MPVVDQVIFFNTTHAAVKFNFELEEGFTFCVADTEDKGRRCGPWNTLCTKKIKRWWPQRRRLSSDSRRRREGASKTAPSKTGCLQDLWHWDQFAGKSAVTATPASKWGSPESYWLRLPRVVNLMNFLESVWFKKRKGVVTVYKPDCRHIHTHSLMQTFQTRRTAAHGPGLYCDSPKSEDEKSHKKRVEPLAPLHSVESR